MGSVGFDISCGIGCLRTDLTWKGLKEYREQLLAEALYQTIPTDVGGWVVV